MKKEDKNIIIEWMQEKWIQINEASKTKNRKLKKRNN